MMVHYRSVGIAVLNGRGSHTVAASAPRVPFALPRLGRADRWLFSVMGGPAMQVPLFIRPLSAVEEQELKAGLRSRAAFTLRRSQILLASARGVRRRILPQK